MSSVGNSLSNYELVNASVIYSDESKSQVNEAITSQKTDLVTSSSREEQILRNLGLLL
jgi:hypothetical protein